MNAVMFRCNYSILRDARIAHYDACQAKLDCKAELADREFELRQGEEYAQLTNDAKRKDYIYLHTEGLRHKLQFLEHEEDRTKLELDVARDQIEMDQGVIELMRNPHLYEESHRPLTDGD